MKAIKSCATIKWPWAGHQSGGVEKSAIFSPNEVYFISPTSSNNHFLNKLLRSKVCKGCVLFCILWGPWWLLTLYQIYFIYHQQWTDTLPAPSVVSPQPALARAVAPVVLYVDSAVLLCQPILTILDLPRLKHPSSVLGEGNRSWNCLWSREGARMSQGSTWISICP